MKKFEFSLDRLLKVKRQLERLAELEQQQAHAAVQAATIRIQSLRQQMIEISDKMSSKVGQVSSPSAWVSAYEYSDHLQKMIAVAQVELNQAHMRLRTATEEREQITKEVMAIAKLRDEKYTAWKQEYAASTQAELDEIGLRNWMSQLQSRQTPIPANTGDAA